MTGIGFMKKIDQELADYLFKQSQERLAAAQRELDEEYEREQRLRRQLERIEREPEIAKAEAAYAKIPWWVKLRDEGDPHQNSYDMEPKETYKEDD